MIKVKKKNEAPGMVKSINPSKAEDPDFNDAIKDLLVGHDGTLEDKIATVKTAQIADQKRFDAAFKTLMKR